MLYEDDDDRYKTNTINKYQENIQTTYNNIHYY